MTPPTILRPASLRSHRARGAFTLLEVAISTGIVTFSLVAILGILPVGLSSFRDATESTVESQIVNQIASEASLMPFFELASYAANSPYYYNEEGSLVESETEAVFSVQISAMSPDYPGKPATIESDLKNLQVQITTLRNRASSKRLHNLFVARSDVQPNAP